MGGNIFDFTGPIRKDDIKPTLLKFFAELKQIFPNASQYFKTMETLGSVGKKELSGDIDLALPGTAFPDLQKWDPDPDRREKDWGLQLNKEWGLNIKDVLNLFDAFKKRAKTSTDDQLMKRAIIVAIGQKIEESKKNIAVDIKGSGAGSLFLAFPQFDENGNELDNSVQIDINVGDIDWLKFAYYSDKYDGIVKGLHRTQLMLSLFTEAGYTFSHNYGVKNIKTQEIEASNPVKAIEILNKVYGFKLTPEILENYFKLQEFLKNNLDQSKLNAVYDRYLKILDSTRADIPEDLQQYWIDNQERLGLKGKFLPDDSNLKKYAIQ